MILKRTASKPSTWLVFSAAMWCVLTVFLTPLVLQLLWVVVLWEQTIDLGRGIALFFLWLFILLGDVLLLQWLYKHSTRSSYWLLGILCAMVLGGLFALV